MNIHIRRSMVSNFANPSGRQSITQNLNTATPFASFFESTRNMSFGQLNNNNSILRNNFRSFVFQNMLN